MAEIYVELKNIKSTNYSIPKIASGVHDVHREIGLLRWRIDPKVMAKRDLMDQLNHIVEDLDKVEHSLGEIYSVTENIITQYLEKETILSEYADQFE